MHLAVFNVDRFLHLMIETEGTSEHIDGACFTDSQWNFILQAVAVRVLVAEGSQDCNQLICGGGSLQTKLCQPLLVDPLLESHAAGIAQIQLRQGIDVTVCTGDGGKNRGILGHECHEIGSVLLKQIVERNQLAAFHTILGNFHF